MMMVVQQSQTHIDLPDGFDVVGLPTLLDPERMKQRLNSCLPRESTQFESCRVTNLRQKTPTSCTICYELTRSSDGGAPCEFAYVRAFSSEEFQDADRRAQQSRWAMTTERLSVTPLHDLCAIVYWFPNDERLDGLRRIVTPKKLQRLFYEHFSEYPSMTWRISDRSIRLQVLRYKPERRAVLKCRFRAQRKDETERHERFVYLGLYEIEKVAELTLTSRRIMHLSESALLWTTAPLLGIDEDNALMIWGELSGTTLRSALSSRDCADDVARCADAIAEMHATDGTSLPPRDSISVQISAVRSFLSSVLPEWVELIDDIARRLDRWVVPAPTGEAGVVHGDLHPGQMILGIERIGLIDFDRSHVGDPLEDIGNVRAQLWLGPPDGAHYDPEAVFGSFLDTYARCRDIASRELDTWTAFSLFRSAVVPLGRFQPDWRNRTRAILQEADRLLS